MSHKCATRGDAVVSFPGVGLRKVCEFETLNQFRPRTTPYTRQVDASGDAVDTHRFR